MGLKRWWQEKFGKRIQARRDEKVIEAYLTAGAQFGDVVSYLYMGECVGFEELLAKWEVAERAYAALGYRTLSIDDFEQLGGWGKPVELYVARQEGEEPVYHAAYYRQNYLHKVKPAIDFAELVKGHVQSGNWAVPTTKHLGKS